MSFAAALAGLIALAAHAQAPALSRIGVAGAVSGKVQAFAPAPQAVGRIVESGKELFLNEKVVTDAGGRLQIMLLDETVFTIGPNSAMTLNEFVYDPKTSAGKVGAKVTQGVFRFITGKVARKDPARMKVDFPVGSVGIRGTIVAGKVEADGSSLVVLLGPGAANNAGEPPGALSFTNAGHTVVIDKPGFGSRIDGEGVPPTTPAIVPQAELSSILSAIAPESKGESGSEPEAASNASPNQEGGQDVAGAEGDLSNITTLGEAAETTDAATAAASQDNTKSATSNGPTSWDAIRQGVTTGQGFYFSGDVGITGGANFASSSPQGALQLQIDFGAKTIGGTGVMNPANESSQSFIHIHGINDSGNSDSYEQTIGQISFAALGGGAVILLKTSPASGTNQAQLGALTGQGTGSGSFNDTSITLVNSGGVLAASALTNMKFTGTNGSSNSVVVDATFSASRQ